MKAEVSAVFARHDRLSSLMGIIRLYTGGVRGDGGAVLIYLRNLSLQTECKRYQVGILWQ